MLELIMQKGFPGMTFFVISLLISFSLFISPCISAQERSFPREDSERLIRLEATLKEFKDSVDKRFEQIDKRFEQIDKRFEQIDKRLEFMQQLMIAMIGVFGGLCGAFVGLLLWDRRTFKEKAKEEALREIERQYRIKDWISALTEYAQEKEDFAKILRKLNLL